MSEYHETVFKAKDEKAIVVFVHGAGESGHTFLMLMREINKITSDYTLVTYDIRGHGMDH
jgi:pimeloyl-ACP methyl ester carboxylesterase